MQNPLDRLFEGRVKCLIIPCESKDKMNPRLEKAGVYLTFVMSIYEVHHTLYDLGSYSDNAGIL